MRGVTLTAHPLTVYPFSFLLSHFSVPTAPADCPPETGATSEAEGVDGYRLSFRYRLLFVSRRIRRNSFHLVVSLRWRWNPQKGTRFTVPAWRGVPLLAHPLHAHRLIADFHANIHIIYNI